MALAAKKPGGYRAAGGFGCADRAGRYALWFLVVEARHSAFAKLFGLVLGRAAPVVYFYQNARQSEEQSGSCVVYITNFVFWNFKPRVTAKSVW